MLTMGKDAVEKICPQRFGASPTAIARCVGAQCMAWRWDRRVDPPTCHWHSVNLPLGSPEPERPANVPASWVWENDSDERDFCRWVEPVEEADLRRRGYCGMAGVP